jgi:hypothetical protein
MNTSNETYQKLDRSALWLLVGEFGLAALLLVLTLLMFIGNLISYDAFNMGYSTGGAIAMGIGLVYGVAYLANLSIGILGLILYARDNRAGYPGTGHLINWILLSATLVIVLIGIAVIVSSM